MQNDNILKWEAGGNRTFDINNLNDQIVVENLNHEGKILINKNPNFYVYDKNTEIIKIKCIWNN